MRSSTCKCVQRCSYLKLSNCLHRFSQCHSDQTLLSEEKLDGWQPPEPLPGPGDPDRNLLREVGLNGQHLPEPVPGPSGSSRTLVSEEKLDGWKSPEPLLGASGGFGLALLSEENLDGRQLPEPSPDPNDPSWILCSEEKLDGRKSPDLWPEPIPGLSQYAGLFSPGQIKKSLPKWTLDPESQVMLQELGSLTTAALLEKVKDLQNMSYKLAVEEAREMARGRFLDVLRDDTKKCKTKK
ncbi:uncharacterized protein LOC144152626 isoform X3 [Haemaphysalis longicornis]